MTPNLSLFAVILRNARPAKVTEMAAEKPQAIVESSLQPSLHPPAEHPFGLAQDDRAAELFRALQPFLDWEAVMVQYNGRCNTTAGMVLSSSCCKPC